MSFTNNIRIWRRIFNDMTGDLTGKDYATATAAIATPVIYNKYRKSLMKNVDRPDQMIFDGEHEGFRSAVKIGLLSSAAESGLYIGCGYFQQNLARSLATNMSNKIIDQLADNDGTYLAVMNEFKDGGLYSDLLGDDDLITSQRILCHKVTKFSSGFLSYFVRFPLDAYTAISEVYTITNALGEFCRPELAPPLNNKYLLTSTVLVGVIALSFVNYHINKARYSLKSDKQKKKDQAVESMLYNRLNPDFMRAYGRSFEETSLMKKLYGEAWGYNALSESAWYLESAWKKFRQRLISLMSMYTFGEHVFSDNFTYSLHYLPLMSNIENLANSVQTMFDILVYEKFWKSASDVHRYYKQAEIIKAQMDECKSRITITDDGDVLINASGAKILLKDGENTLTIDDFEIHRGEIVMLEGENGIGKSSFFRSVLHGIGIEEGSNIARTDDIFMALQKTELPKQGLLKEYVDISSEEFTNVASKLCFFDVLKEKAKVIACKKLNIQNPTDEETKEFLGDIKLSEFSGGQSDKLKILLALSSGKSLIFMDETFASIDGENKETIQNFIKEYITEKGIGICVVDHAEKDNYLEQGFYTKRYLAEEIEGERHVTAAAA